MSLAIGITGLSQAGKSSLFQTLTSMSGSETGGKRGASKSRVAVPDPRLTTLSKMFNPEKTTPAFIDFVDMPGGGKGGLGAQALGEIRSATALVEVVRCFDHPYLGAADPEADMESFEMELTLSDLKIVEGKLERKKKLQPGEQPLLEMLQPPLAEGRPWDLPELDEEELKLLAGLGLLTIKPRIYAANVAEDQLGGELAAKIHEFAKERKTESIETCALLESEVAQLAEEERADFLKELGIEETGLAKIVRAGYRRLGLLTYFTVGEDEVRAWNCPIDSLAPQAARAIHSDLERGFIRAEAIHYDTFLECGSLNEAKNQGKLRVEGKTYVVQDGDILSFRVNT